MDDREEGESEWLLLAIGNVRNLVKEVMSIRANKFLHLVPVVLLERTLKILDHQIHSAEGLSIVQSENVSLRSLYLSPAYIHIVILELFNI